MAKYIQDLLDLTRLNQAPEFNFAPLNLCIRVEGIRAAMAPAAEAKQIDLLMIAETKSLPILADQRELNRALINLVENAIHYTPVGGRVELVVRQEGENVRLRVADTGIGIDKADVALILERFFTARRRRKRCVRAGLGWDSLSPSRSSRYTAAASASKARPASARPSYHSATVTDRARRERPFRLRLVHPQAISTIGLRESNF